MSSQSRSYGESDDRPLQIGEPPVLSMPEDWTLSTPWRRAQEEYDRGGRITDAERMVFLSGGEDVHRVTWALKGRTLSRTVTAGATSSTTAGVPTLPLWQWVRGEIVVSHLDTGRE